MSKIVSLCSKTVIFISLCLFSLATIAQTYHTSINGSIDINSCRDAIETLHEAHRGDIVILDLQSFGGTIDPYWIMKKELKDNHERLVINVDQVACSAASFILMLGNEKHVSSSALVVFHTGHLITPWGDIRFSVYSPDPQIRHEAYKSLAIMQSYHSLFSNREWEMLRSGDDVVVNGNRINQYYNLKYR